MAHLSRYSALPMRRVPQTKEACISVFYPAVFINLFCVPLLPVYLYYKSRRQPLAPSLELLFQYFIVVSLNHVAVHVISRLIFALTGASYSPDSAHYTLVAILAAVLLFMAAAAAKYLKPEINIFKVEEDNEENEQE